MEQELSSSHAREAELAAQNRDMALEIENHRSLHKVRLGEELEYGGLHGKGLPLHAAGRRTAALEHVVTSLGCRKATRVVTERVV